MERAVQHRLASPAIEPSDEHTTIECTHFGMGRSQAIHREPVGETPPLSFTLRTFD